MLSLVFLAAAVCTGPEAIDPARELYVDAPAVIQDQRADPGGPWHFASVVRSLLPTGATDAEVSRLVSDWFSSWEREQALTPDPLRPESPENPLRVLAPRPGVGEAVLAPWLAASRAARAAAGAAEDGSLQLSLAPFALRAIVYRPDLRDAARCATSAGEGRYVFAVLKEPTEHPAAVTGREDVQQFTLIFEFDLPTGLRTAQDWAASWHALSAGSAERYLERLEALTRGFTYGATLGQIRSNEILVFPSELRQFSLDEVAPGRFAIRNAALAQTPDWSLTNGAALSQWAFEHRDEIMTASHGMPPALGGLTALAPRAKKWQLQNPGGLAREELEELRFTLSKNTCNGCHAFEHPRVANVDGLWHVAPDGRTSRHLRDEELPRRASEVCGLLNAETCSDLP